MKTVNIPVSTSGGRQPSLGLIEVTRDGTIIETDFPLDVSRRIVRLIERGKARGAVRVRATRYSWDV